MDEKTILYSLDCCPRKAHHEPLRYYNRAPQNPKQTGHAAFHRHATVEAIADSITDITQDEDVVFYGLNILPNLNMGQNSSPLDGVILKVLRSRWDRSRLCTRVWAKGHSQRMIMQSAGASFNPMESAQLTQLAAEVMRHCAQS